VEGPAAPTGAIGLSCRIYGHGSVREGVPPVDLIRRAVSNAKEAPR